MNGGQIDINGHVALRNCVTGAFKVWFADPSSGDLRLTAEADGAIGKAIKLDEVVDDFDGRPRDASRRSGRAKTTRGVDDDAGASGVRSLNGLGLLTPAVDDMSS